MKFDEEVVRAYWELMVMSRKYYPHDEERARDLASDTFVKILEARDRFDESRPLLPWCRVILHNTFLTLIKKKELLITDNFNKENEGGTEADQRAVLLQTLSIIRMLRRKSVCIDTLIEFAKGYSVAEIAAAHGLSACTVKWRVHEARKILKNIIN